MSPDSRKFVHAKINLRENKSSRKLIVFKVHLIILRSEMRYDLNPLMDTTSCIILHSLHIGNLVSHILFTYLFILARYGSHHYLFDHIEWLHNNYDFGDVFNVLLLSTEIKIVAKKYQMECNFAYYRR